MTVLLAGATGATGKLAAEQLLEKGFTVKGIVRSRERLPESVRNHKNFIIIEASLPAMTEAELSEIVSGCHAIISCLGHNLTLKGIFGKPRKLVHDAVRLLCDSYAAASPEKPAKLILMNTTGNRNKDSDEKRTFAETLAIGLIRLLLPPQRDNEYAAEYLRTEIGQENKNIEWVAVRPDGLVDHDNLSEYTLFPSPVRSPIFDAGETSRINVAYFMAELLADDNKWSKWKGKMPVIYNKSSMNE